MVPDAQWGFASSPIIHNGRVILQADVQKGSFVAAFDVRTGKELWRTPRADVPTWSTPAVVSMNGRDQVIVNGWKHIGGYDLETGKEIWRMTGGGDIPVPTPIAAHGLVFITNAHGKVAPIYAIKPTASGDISLKEGESSNAHIAWSYMRDGGYMQTPIVYGDILYVCRDNGVLTRVRCEDRHAPLPGAARRRQDRLLRVGGRIGRTALLHERRRRRLCGEGGHDLRVAGDESAGRSRDGDAGDLGRHAALPHAQSPGRGRRALMRTWIASIGDKLQRHLDHRRPEAAALEQALRRSFCAAVPSTTRGMPRSRSHSIAASSSASPTPPPRAASLTSRSWMKPHSSRRSFHDSGSIAAYT